MATQQGNVSVSMPYDPDTVAEITRYMRNTTNVTLESPVWSGRFATLVVLGNQADNASNATGASVAEWAIIGEGGSAM